MAELFEKMDVAFIQDESVQELAVAFGDADDVPARYARPQMDAGGIVREQADDLPVVDMKRLQDPSSNLEEVARLGSACAEWGFFQLINHGVDDVLVAKMKHDIKNFFSLPLEEKRKIAIPPGGLQGYGHHFIMSEGQKLDWGDMIFLATRPVEERNMSSWPMNPATFRNTLEEYTLALKDVAESIFGFLAADLGIEPEVLLNAYKDLPQSVRINYYPRCRQADKVLGLSPHTDAVGLTILLQVNDVQGLQIRKGGKWFPVQAIPGAFVVNVGDSLEILSNGKYRSIEHRAVVDAAEERMTIATFHSHSMLHPVGPLPAVVGDGKPRYRTISCPEFTKAYFSAKLEGRNFLEGLKAET